MKGLDMTQNINRAGASALRKRSLLGSTALAAATTLVMGASGAAYGDDVDIANGAVAVSKLLATNTLVDKTNNNVGILTLTASKTLGSTSLPGIIIDTHDNGLNILATTADDIKLDINGSVGIVDSKTLTFIVGNKADGTAGAKAFTLNFNNFIGGLDDNKKPDASKRGGNLTFQTALSKSANMAGKTVTINTAGMKVKELTLTGVPSSGTATKAGVNLKANIGKTAADSIDVTKVHVVGGKSTTTLAGGNVDVTINGSLTVGGAIDVDGGSGAAGTTANAGKAKLTIATDLGDGSGTKLTGDITVDGGISTDDAASGAGKGGDAELVLKGVVNIVKAVTVTGGRAGTGKTANGATGGSATLLAEKSFTTTKDITVVGGAASATSAFDDADGGDATATFNAAVTGKGSNLIVKGGAASVKASTGKSDAGHAVVNLKGDATFDDILIEGTDDGGTGSNTAGGNATVVLNGEGDQIIDAFIGGEAVATGSGIGVATLQNSNTKGIVTFNKAIGITSADSPVDKDHLVLTLDEGTKTVFKSTIKTDRLFTIKGNSEVTFDDEVDLNLQSAAGLDTSGVTAAKKLIFTVGSGFKSGDKDKASATVIDITASGGLYTGATAEKSITLKLPSDFVSGHIVLIKTTSGGVSSAEEKAFDVTDTLFANYEVEVGDGAKYKGTLANTDIVVVATEYGEADVAKELAKAGVTNAAFAPVIMQARKAVVSTTGDDNVKIDKELETAFSAVISSGDKAKVKKLVEQAAVQTDTLGAVVGATAAAGASSFGVVTERLASLRTGGALGIATGDHVHANGKSVYIKAFGTSASQDADGEVKGFDATTFGTAFGVDGEISEGSVLGASFSVSSSEVEGDGTGASELDLDTYQANVYGQVDVGGFFVDGMFGYGWTSIDSSRKIEVGKIKEATADYDGNILMASVGAGVPVDLSGVSLTPRGSFTYTNVSYDSYTETGASTLSQKVAQDDVASGLLELGATVQTSSEGVDGFVITPSLRAGVFYDLIGDEAKATANYTGGGSSFNVKGAGVDKFGGTVGVGLMGSKDNLSLSANYDATLKGGYTAHSGEVKLNIGF
jgi:outer membrane autotransporter protein